MPLTGLDPPSESLPWLLEVQADDGAPWCVFARVWSWEGAEAFAKIGTNGTWRVRHYKTGDIAAGPFHHGRRW